MSLSKVHTGCVILCREAYSNQLKKHAETLFAESGVRIEIFGPACVSISSDGQAIVKKEKTKCDIRMVPLSIPEIITPIPQRVVVPEQKADSVAATQQQSTSSEGACAPTPKNSEILSVSEKPPSPVPVATTSTPSSLSSYKHLHRPGSLPLGVMAVTTQQMAAQGNNSNTQDGNVGEGNEQDVSGLLRYLDTRPQSTTYGMQALRAATEFVQQSNKQACTPPGSPTLSLAANFTPTTGKGNKMKSAVQKMVPDSPAMGAGALLNSPQLHTRSPSGALNRQQHTNSPTLVDAIMPYDDDLIQDLSDNPIWAPKEQPNKLDKLIAVVIHVDADNMKNDDNSTRTGEKSNKSKKDNKKKEERKWKQKDDDSCTSPAPSPSTVTTISTCRSSTNSSTKKLDEAIFAAQVLSDVRAKILKTIGNHVGPTYFLSVRITNPSITQKIQELQKHVTTEFPKFSATLIPAYSLHITLMVFKIFEYNQLQKLKEMLSYVVKDMYKQTVNSASSRAAGDIILEMDGIDGFRQNVVFIKPRQDQNYIRLQSFRNSLHNYIYDALPEVFNYQKETDWTPHCTVMKSSHVRNRSLSKIPKESWKPFASEYYGTQQLMYLELSAMSDKGDDGYYRCEQAIKLTDNILLDNVPSPTGRSSVECKAVLGRGMSTVVAAYKATSTCPTYSMSLVLELLAEEQEMARKQQDEKNLVEDLESEDSADDFESSPV